MASAQIIILQDGQGTAPGVSTDTLDLALPVTLRNSSAGDLGVSVWQWTLVGVPLGSTATLSGSQSAVAGFTPDLAGTYMVKLEVNGGGATGETQIRLAVVREAIGGVGSLPELLVRVPGPAEGNEANWAGNAHGWWADFALLLNAMKVVYAVVDAEGSGGPGPGPGPGQDVNSALGSFPSVPGADVVVEDLGEIPPDTVWTFHAEFSAASSTTLGVATSSLIHLLGTARRGSSGDAQVDFELLPKPGSMSGDTASVSQNPANPNEIRLIWRSNAPSGDNVTLHWSRLRTVVSTLAIP